jgi:hypothetical protein
VAKQNIFQFFLIFHSFFLVKLKAAMAPADALPSVHPSIICDFIEGKLFRVNEIGGKEETNEMKATQPPLFSTACDQNSGDNGRRLGTFNRKKPSRNRK